MKQCAWCQTYFEYTVIRQVYCSKSCRFEATKHIQQKKSKERKIKSRKKKIRICANSDCETKLSIYNDSKYCANCFFSEHTVAKEINSLKSLARKNKNGSKGI